MSIWRVSRANFKGIRDIFDGKTQEEKEEFTEESDDMINEAGITKENEIPGRDHKE